MCDILTSSRLSGALVVTLLIDVLIHILMKSVLSGPVPDGSLKKLSKRRTASYYCEVRDSATRVFWKREIVKSSDDFLFAEYLCDDTPAEIMGLCKTYIPQKRCNAATRLRSVCKKERYSVAHCLQHLLRQRLKRASVHVPQVALESYRDLSSFTGASNGRR